MDDPDTMEADRADVLARPFVQVLDPSMPSPVLLAVPHAGRAYPSDLIANMRDADFATIRLEDRLVDLIARQIARSTGAGLIVARAPRAMIDLNRSVEDMDWTMVAEGRPEGVTHSAANRRARGGLGLVPRRLNGLGEIWRSRLSCAEVSRRVKQVHEPYHRALRDTLDRIRSRWGAALLIDLHSMPPLRIRSQREGPAHFVVGDRFGASCDGMLSAGALRYFARNDCRVAHNRPYAGGYVLDRHGVPSIGIHAMQIEICRSLYLEDDQRSPNRHVDALANLLSGMVRELSVEVTPQSRWTQAAE